MNKINYIASVLIIISVLFLFGFGLFSTGVIVGAASTSVKAGTEMEKKIAELPGDVVVEIDLDGIITEEGDSGSFGSSSSISSRALVTQIDELSHNDKVKGLLLRINSPGGSAVASEDIYQALVSFRKNGGYVVASLGDIAASGGYYIALGADKIVTSPSALTGSIGVLTEITNLEGLFSNFGIKHEVYKSGQYKDIMSFSRDRTEEEKAMIQSALDDTYVTFVTRVAQSRGISLERAEELSQGKIYSGIQSQKLNLTDALGNITDAELLLAKIANLRDYSTTKLNIQPTLFDRFFSSTQFGSFLGLKSTGSSGMWYLFTF